MKSLFKSILVFLSLWGMMWGAFRSEAVVPFSRIVKPTDCEKLDPAVAGSFQPTAAGTVESALYGSVRTVQVGKRMFPSFHEGIDIAPLQRTKRGVPTDEVRAVAEGTVGYVNRKSGNSNYGNYVVLLHQDEMGTVYTLYSHLAVIAPDLRVEQAVVAGQMLGIMGNSSSSGIPMSRAHLHFEVGLIANERFGAWFRAQKLKPDHGLFNGQNLFAINPLDFFNHEALLSAKGFRGLVAIIPRAFTLVTPAGRQLDYFRRYPSLWEGAPFQGGAMVLSCAENGTILSGRTATPDELNRVKSGKTAILDVDEKVLGRNGPRLVVKDQGRWRLGEKGTRWLEILKY